MELTHWTKLCFKPCLAVFSGELSLLNFYCFFFFLAAPTERLHVIVSCDPPPQSESVDPRFPPTRSQRVTEEFHLSQGVKLQNTPWSRGQGRKTAVKNLDPGRKREYSKYGSDLPLLCVIKKEWHALVLVGTGTPWLPWAWNTFCILY